MASRKQGMKSAHVLEQWLLTILEASNPKKTHRTLAEPLDFDQKINFYLSNIF